MSEVQSSKILCVCKMCGKHSYLFPSRVKSGYGTFCSKACQHAPLEQRFWMSLGRKAPSGCILWNGHITKDGYGRIRDRGTCRLAHRVAYELMVGKIPEDLIIRHSCDNKICINPTHLLLGTQIDNVADREERKRTAIGAANGKAKLNSALVTELRARYAAGGITQQDLASEYGIPGGTIGAIINHLTWKHVTPPSSRPAAACSPRSPSSRT